jgi:hypothetical protein
MCYLAFFVSSCFFQKASVNIAEKVIVDLAYVVYKIIFLSFFLSFIHSFSLSLSIYFLWEHSTGLDFVSIT